MCSNLGTVFAATSGVAGSGFFATSDLANVDRFGSEGAHVSSAHSNPRNLLATNARATVPGSPAGVSIITPCMAFFLAASSKSWHRCFPRPLRCAAGSTCKSRRSRTGTPSMTSRTSPSTLKRKCANAIGFPVLGAFLDLGARSVTRANRDEGSHISSMSACGDQPWPSGLRFRCTRSSAQSSSSSVIVLPVRKCTSSARPSRSYFVKAPKLESTSRSPPSSSRNAARRVVRWCFSVLMDTFLCRASPLLDLPLDLEPPPLLDLPLPQADMVARA